MKLFADVAELLDEQGPFPSLIPGFQGRQAQQAMARAVADTLSRRRTLICEAGTGTGKTYAYLVPACLAEGPVLISTGTRTLQEQLYLRDMPMVCRALERPRRLAMLKGRGNYLCRYRLQMCRQSGQLPLVQQGQLLRITAWAGRTRSGDIEEVEDVPGDSPIWPQVTSTTDNCLGQDCGDYDRCHVVEARRQAQNADIVIINHHLLFSDMRLRNEGHGDLLPACQAVIVDEAHQLPELASQFFGQMISAHRLRVLARDIVRCQAQEAPEAQRLGDLADELFDQVDVFRRTLGHGSRRGAWQQVSGQAGTAAAIDRLQALLAQLVEALELLAERGKGLENCRLRCADLALVLRAVVDGEDSDFIRWFESSAQGFRLHRTPIDSADAFREQMTHYPDAAWIFTSATLAVGEDFSHFAARLGIDDHDSGQWSSPFDYPRQALLYLPRGLPEPSSRDYNARVVDIALPVLKASGGRAFFLFTSHQALRQAAERLREARLPYPVLIQGEMPRGLLLQSFREQGNAILLGTASFWEGVDVRGEALSCVIIDKLPFASPDDPVFQARSTQLRRNGGNPFRSLQLPQAVIALKQGAGRLIRDVQDRGVLVLCDPRLMTRGYGKTFLNNLPPMRRCHDLAAVEDFFSVVTAADETVIVEGAS